MYRLGIDCGTSTIKLALVEETRLCKTWLGEHHGVLLPTLLQGLAEMKLPADVMSAAVTGSNSQVLLDIRPDLFRLGDIPAVVEGVRRLSPQAGCVIEIGSQGARFITGLAERVPRFAVNEHCAGGTGSFFEDQMARLGLKIEDYSCLVEQARSIPRLSGRCAVFAKTDIIHRQQEGVPTPDILLGLCYAMIRNYKATIVRDLPVQRPVAFCGGVICNSGVIRAIREVFGLDDGDLIIPEQGRFAAAAGAAYKAEGKITVDELLTAIHAHHKQSHSLAALPPLKLTAGTRLVDPEAVGLIPPEGCALGIDIGSTSTAFVLVSRDGVLLDFQYLRTAGDPEGAVRKGLSCIRERFGMPDFLAVGVTGSGRERIGRMLGADAIRDEITAQAKATVHWAPEADTVFEIGGQDSKYISLQDGNIADFQMNKICAAGTGSFVEEQASRMGIPLEEFGPLALTAATPAELGERCTVFIETAIASAEAQGAGQADIAAGLCHSIVRNYLHKVVAGKPVGAHIVLQGGVAYNPGIVAAFQHAYGKRLAVSPCFSISGAYGASLLALEAVGAGKSTFKGFDFPASDSLAISSNEEIGKNFAFYRKAGELLRDGYDGKREPGRPTVGIPLVLLMHRFFPLANVFFKRLGFNVLLTAPTSEETIHLSQQYAQGETCYSVKLIYGHMAQLAAKKVDYIFLPTVRTLKHEISWVANNYGCVYMQTAPRSIARILKIEEKGIQLLSPVFDLDFGKKAMASSMIDTGKELGFSRLRCMKALLSGALAVRRYTARVEQLGKELLASLKPEDKVLVLITRNYGLADPALSMGIPELLMQRGHKVITLSHLPGHDLDMSEDYPNLYWPFAQHILSGAKIIARHPNLYAVYLTNHGCGPDSMISHFFRQEMGNKPYLQIEVDEHFSKVGVITRIEAFLNSLSSRPAQPLPVGFDLSAVTRRRAAIGEKPEADKPLYIPDLGWYTAYLADYFRRTAEIDVRPMRSSDKKQLALGRAETGAKEYLPFPALLGGIFDTLGTEKEKGAVQFLIPFTQGAEADGQYAGAVRAVLDRRGLKHIGIVSPVLERLPQTAKDIELLFRALLTGDLLYSADPNQRTSLAPKTIPEWEQLLTLAQQIGSQPDSGRRLAAVGTPMCLTSLDDGVLKVLEREGNTVARAPLAEYMWFLWNDNSKDREFAALLLSLRKRMSSVSEALKKHSAFSADLDALTRLADDALPNYAGGNGRYRWAKAVQMGNRSQAVLTLAPRYENTAVVLDMRSIHKSCPVPLFQISLDGDWDEAAWTRLRSFLYYC